MGFVVKESWLGLVWLGDPLKDINNEQVEECTPVRTRVLVCPGRTPNKGLKATTVHSAP